MPKHLTASPIRSAAMIIMLLFAFGISHTQDLKEFKDSLQGKKLSITKWASLLDTIFENKVAGWAYQIVQNKKIIESKQSGYAVIPADMKDGQGIPFTVNTIMHIASVSKTITAVAMAKILGEKKLSWDEKVKNYLPSAWTIHPRFADITIRQLMRMESGLNAALNTVTSSVDSLRFLLEKGPDETKVGKFNYQNTSYGLLRIVIAYMLGYKELNGDEDEKNKSVAIGNLYVNYVKEKIFGPAGIMDASCRMETGLPTLMYPSPVDNLSGIISGIGTPALDGDLTSCAGGFGWYISVSSLSIFFQKLFIDKTVLTKKELEGLLGVDYPLRLYKNRFGEYRQGGGDWRLNKPGMSYTCGLQTSYYIFPNNIQVVVFHNSAFSARAAIMRTYLASFE